MKMRPAFKEIRSQIQQFGNPLNVVSSCLRGMIIPSEGCDFIGVDYSSIEARITAWLANEKKVLSLFEKNKDVYVAAAAAIYGIPESEVTKDQRQVGKVAELALGYGGGEGAFMQMSKGYGVKVAKNQATDIKIGWRNNRQNTVQMWHALEQAAITAMKSNREVPTAHKVSYKKSGSFLLCRLPSDRFIIYPYPKLEWKMAPWGEQKETITAKWVNSMTKKWERRDLWYGILTENIVQALARDILKEALLYLHKEGYEIVAHVHDEILVEIDKKILSVDYLIMLIYNSIPDWAEGLPIRAEGWRGVRYQK